MENSTSESGVTVMLRDVRMSLLLERTCALTESAAELVLRVKVCVYCPVPSCKTVVERVPDSGCKEAFARENEAQVIRYMIGSIMGLD